MGTYEQDKRLAVGQMVDDIHKYLGKDIRTDDPDVVIAAVMARSARGALQEKINELGDKNRLTWTDVMILVGILFVFFVGGMMYDMKILHSGYNEGYKDGMTETEKVWSEQYDKLLETKTPQATIEMPSEQELGTLAPKDITITAPTKNGGRKSK